MGEPIDRLLALADRLGLRVIETSERPQTGGVLVAVDVRKDGKSVGHAWAIGFGPRAEAIARDSVARDLLPVGG